MRSYYDALDDFYKLNERQPLQSSAQLVYLHLLHVNERLGNMGTVRISDRELELRTRLSKQTITDVKRNLKNVGLIDFQTDRTRPAKGTTYLLKFFTDLAGTVAGQKVGQQVGQMVGQMVGQTIWGCPRFDSLICDAGENNTREHEGNTATAAESAALPSPPPLPPTPPIPTPAPLQSNDTIAGAREKVTATTKTTAATDKLAGARALPLSAPTIQYNGKCNDIDEIISYWQFAGGAKMNRWLISKFQSLLPTHGLQEMKNAIDKAVSAANNTDYGFSFDYFLTKLDGKILDREKEKEKKKRKGSEKRGDKHSESSTTNYEYEVPDYTNAPWRLENATANQVLLQGLDGRASYDADSGGGGNCRM